MKTEDLILDISQDINDASLKSERTFISTITKHSARYGAEKFLFGSALYHDLQPCPDISIITTYPQEWQAHYHQKNYFEEDLTVAHCKEKNTPIVWPTHNKNITHTNKRIFSEASDLGIKSGISFPFHTATGEYGALAASTSERYNNSDLNKPENLFALQILGSTVFDILRTKGKKCNKKILTEREKECLKWVAAGKTSWEISVITGVAERTVVFHIKNATSKMNTASRTNAAVVALLNGEIEL